MAFAQDEAEFASLFEEMKTTVLGLGYEQVLAVDRLSNHLLTRMVRMWLEFF